jgi:hypothetical protein
MALEERDATIEWLDKAWMNSCRRFSANLRSCTPNSLVRDLVGTERDNGPDAWRQRIIEFIPADSGDAYTAAALLTAIGIKKPDRNAYRAVPTVMESLGWYCSLDMGHNGRRVRSWRRTPY